MESGGADLLASHRTWPTRLPTPSYASAQPNAFCFCFCLCLCLCLVCCVIVVIVPSNKQQRFSSKLLRGLPPAKTRRRGQRRRRLGRRGLGTAAIAVAAARRAPSPDLPHDQTRRRAVPDAFSLLLRVEPPYQKLAVFRVVREASTKTYAEHDAAQHRARHAGATAATAAAVAVAGAAAYASCWYALQTFDRFPYAVADLGTARMFARYHRV